MFGNQPSPYSSTRSSTRGPVPPTHTGSGLLHRLGPRPDALEVDELAVEGGLVVRPDLAHRQHALAHDREAPRRVGAVVAHLLEVPAGADAELEAPAGEVVERRRLVGEHDRVALDDQRDAGADAQALGRGRDRAQRHERVERVRVLARQLGAARPRRSRGWPGCACARGRRARRSRRPRPRGRASTGAIVSSVMNIDRPNCMGYLRGSISSRRSPAGAWSTCSVTCSMPKRSPTMRLQRAAHAVAVVARA